MTEWDAEQARVRRLKATCRRDARSTRGRLFRRLCGGAVLAVLASVAGCRPSGFEGGTYRPMQEDFDRIRLDHLFILDTLIREYAAATGAFPFADGSDSLPQVVVIATPQQYERNQDLLRIRVDLALRAENGAVPPQPPRIVRHSPAAFLIDVSRAIGREFQMPLDPQQVPVNKPSLYVYVMYRGVYDVSAFLHQDLPFARALGPYHSKVALSNRTLASAGIWRREDLLADTSLRQMFAAPFNRGGYVLRTDLPPQ